MCYPKTSCVFIFCLILTSVSAATELRIGTFDVARGGIGSLLSDDREWVRTAIDTSFVGVSLAGAPTLTAAFTDTLDLLWLDAVAGGTLPIVPLDTDEQQVLGQFVTNGGGAVIFTDTDLFAAANQSLLAPFGIVSAGLLSGDCHVTVTDPYSSPVTNAFFGLIEEYWTGWPGWYADLGDYAVGLATLDANGQIHLAFIDREMMSPEAGGAVFMADHRTGSLALMLNSVLAVTPAAVPTAVGEDETPGATRLEGVYPNPFNPSTSVAFHLSRSGEIRLTMHGVDGRCVAILFEGHLEQGRNVVVWETNNVTTHSMPSGVYLCRLQAGDQVDTQKVTLLK